MRLRERRLSRRCCTTTIIVLYGHQLLLYQTTVLIAIYLSLADSASAVFFQLLFLYSDLRLALIYSTYNKINEEWSVWTAAAVIIAYNNI